MENVMILDTETTGLEPDKGFLIAEVGALLYSVKYRTVLQSICTLLPVNNNPAQHVNFIDHKWTLEKYNNGVALTMLDAMAATADYVIAHNAPFDRKFMRTIHGSKVNDMEWICTKANFKWPVQLFRYRLEDICNAMGVPYVGAHRALADCNFIAQCFSKIEDLTERLEMAAKHLHGNRFR
jgi:DNA polymerase-3 subunit epsilon